MDQGELRWREKEGEVGCQMSTKGGRGSKALEETEVDNDPGRQESR